MLSYEKKSLAAFLRFRADAIIAAGCSPDAIRDILRTVSLINSSDASRLNRDMQIMLPVCADDSDAVSVVLGFLDALRGAASGEQLLMLMPLDLRNNEIQYVGDYRNGRRHGRGKLFCNGKLVYEGEFANDMRNGKGVQYEYWSAVRVACEGDFDCDFLYGQVAYRFDATRWSVLAYIDPETCIPCLLDVEGRDDLEVNGNRICLRIHDGITIADFDAQYFADASIKDDGELQRVSLDKIPGLDLVTSGYCDITYEEAGVDNPLAILPCGLTISR